MASKTKFEALRNVPAELYGGAPGDRVEKGKTFEVEADDADTLKGYTERLTKADAKRKSGPYAKKA